MKYSKARAIVAISFVSLMAVNFLKGINEFPQSSEIIMELLNIYSVQLTLIIMFYFTQSKSIKEQDTPPTIAPVITTLLVILMTGWNAVLFHLLHACSYTTFLNVYPDVINQSNFLVAGGMTYFFTKNNH